MVRLDVRIEGTDSSLEVPAGPRSEIEASCGAEMDQRIAPPPRMEADIPRRLELDLDVQTGGARINNFSTIDVDGSEIEAEGTADTLGIVSGDGIALIVDDGRLVVATTGGSAGFDVEVLDELPDEGEPQVLYLVPSEDPDVYDEYLWVSSSAEFRKIGTTGIDLTGYVTDEELADAVADLVSDTDLAAALADYVTDSDLSTALAGKANASHTHAIADTTGLQSALDGKANSSHTHVKSDVTDLGEATSSSAGLMSAADKAKLDGIETGAQVNAVTGVKGNEESDYRVGNINLTPANIGAAESSHTHSNATTTAAGFMSADQVRTLSQMEIFRAVCTGVQNVGGTCVCTVSAYKGLLQVSNGTLLIVQFNAAWQTDSAVEMSIAGASSNMTVCTVGAGGAWPPVSASNPLKWQTGSVMLFLCDWTNKKVLLLSRNLPIDAADIQTGTLDAARIPELPYLPTSGGTLTGDLDLDGAGLTYESETAYPTFIRSSWSTSSDESTLPVTPCFVLDTSNGGLYWCDGTGPERVNPAYMSIGGRTHSGGNLNDQTNGEVWWGNNFVNAPNNLTGYFRVVKQADVQTAYYFVSNSAAPRVWVRSYTNSTWQPWGELSPVLSVSEATMSGTSTTVNGNTSTGRKYIALPTGVTKSKVVFLTVYSNSINVIPFNIGFSGDSVAFNLHNVLSSSVTITPTAVVRYLS